jgi:hypothetical protein
MKLSNIFNLASQAAFVLSIPTEPHPMDTTGISTPDDSPVETLDNLAKREKCYYDTHPSEGPYKCSKEGWCYKECDKFASHGKWCWAAWNKGNGDWVSCKTNWDCGRAVDIRYSGDGYAMCAKGNCKNCGCFCN